MLWVVVSMLTIREMWAKGVIVDTSLIVERDGESESASGKGRVGEERV